MKQIVDLTTWRRRGSFEFFRPFLNPFITVTSEIACTGSREQARHEGSTFFLRYLYAILSGVNAIEEFRYRIDAREQVVLFDQVDALTFVATDNRGTFRSQRIPYHPDYRKFVSEAIPLMQPDVVVDPFEAEKEMLADEQIDVVAVSAVPSMYFTSIVPAQENRYGSSYPLFTVGKMQQREGVERIPISISAHHGFVDGYQIGALLNHMETMLNCKNVDL